MAFEQQDNGGALFKNDKEGNENRPDSKGKAKIGGVEYYVAAWRKEGSSGTKFLSLSFQRVDDSQKPQQDNKEPDPTDDLDMDIPF